MSGATTGKTTAYMRLVKKKKSHCEGKTTKAEVRKAASAYVKSAVKNGKSKDDAIKTANKVLKKSCKVKGTKNV